MRLSGFLQSHPVFTLTELQEHLGERKPKSVMPLIGSAGEKCQHVAEQNVSTRPTRCSAPLATRQVG